MLYKSFSTVIVYEINLNKLTYKYAGINEKEQLIVKNVSMWKKKSFILNISRKKRGQYVNYYIYTFYSLKLKYILYNLLTHTNNIFCRYSVRTFNIV